MSFGEWLLLERLNLWAVHERQAKAITSFQGKREDRRIFFQDLHFF